MKVWISIRQIWNTFERSDCLITNLIPTSKSILGKRKKGRVKKEKVNVKNPYLKKTKQDKVKKYAPMSRDFYMVPICVKTTGVWGPSGYKFIKELGRLTSERTKEKRSTSFLMQNISMEIQRGNCASVLCIHSQPKTFKWALWALQIKGPWLAQQLFIYSSYLIFLTKTVQQHKSSINIIFPSIFSLTPAKI